MDTLNANDAPLSLWLQSKLEASETILLDEGWDRLHKDGIQLLHNVVKGNDITKSPFSTMQYSMLYNLTFAMSGYPSQIDYSLDLYHRCEDSIETFLVTEMIPMLKSSELGSAFEITQVVLQSHVIIFDLFINGILMFK